MIGKGYIPPPIDIEETLKNYSTSAEIDTILNNYWKEIYPIGYIYSDINNDPNILFGGTWELIESTLTDNEQLNNYFGTTGLTIETSGDQKWLTLVSHDVNSGNRVYSSVAEALNCTTAGKLSRLYLLQKTHNIFLNSASQYEFKLKYPSLGDNLQNHWRQTSNPLNTCQSVTGYSPISINWANSYWGGISRQNTDINTKSSCLLSGSQHANWWFAICSYSAYEGGIPGPNNTIITGYTNLYIRVPGLESSSLLDNHYNLLKESGVKFWKRVA